MDQSENPFISLIYMPFPGLHPASLAVTYNNYEKLLCASCSSSSFKKCNGTSLQLPKGVLFQEITNLIQLY